DPPAIRRHETDRQRAPGRGGGDRHRDLHRVEDDLRRSFGTAAEGSDRQQLRPARGALRRGGGRGVVTMQIGVPKEIKDNEYRVSLVPAGVRALVEHGHQVLVQDGAGLGSGIENEAYEKAGGVIVADAAAVFRRADLVVKVKEPLAT